MSNGPKTLAEYLDWAKVTLGSDFKDPKTQRIYEVNVNNCFNAISGHVFFKRLQVEMEKWEEEYTRLTKSGLLMEKAVPTLTQKTYSSAVEKSFRVNIMWNEKFPKPPTKGWGDY